MATMRKVLIWGAGRIGRGFAADLLDEAGYGLVFVDQAEELVVRLRERGAYTVVRTTGQARQDRTIRGFEALSTADGEAVAAALVDVDLVVVAVYPRDFVAVAEQMATGLLARREARPDAALDIILCANLAHAGPAFRNPLMDALPAARDWAEAQVGVVESLVIRMVADPPPEALARDPLLVWTNGYAAFPVDRAAFRGPIPVAPALRLVEDMRAEEMRKLYTYNTFHAALAYLGALRGHDLAVEALADPWVRERATAALRESAAALQTAYGFEADEMAAWVEGVVTQTDNPSLGDKIARFGADPRRKLGREDRLVGPLLLARQAGIDAPHLMRACAGALCYEAAGDDGAAYVRQQVQSLGVEEAIRVLCGLGEGEVEVVQAVARAYRRLPVEVAWAARADEAYRLGFAYEGTYKGCGQCILAAVQDATGLFAADAFNGAFEAATGLAGGIGLCGDGTCSAFTGGALALGLYSPRRRDHFDGDRENKYRAYDLIQRLRARFVAQYGGIRCHELHRHELGRAFDLRDPAEREAFEAAGAHDDKCTGVVARAAWWVVEIIGQDQVESMPAYQRS